MQELSEIKHKSTVNLGKASNVKDNAGADGKHKRAKSVGKKPAIFQLFGNMTA